MKILFMKINLYIVFKMFYYLLVLKCLFGSFKIWVWLSGVPINQIRMIKIFGGKLLVRDHSFLVTKGMAVHQIKRLCYLFFIICMNVVSFFCENMIITQTVSNTYLFLRFWLQQISNNSARSAKLNVFL